MFIAAIATAITQAAPALPERKPRQDRCASAVAPIDTPCTLPLRVSPSAAGALLGDRDWIWWISGDTLTMVARGQEGGPDRLCCAIQMPVEPVPESSLVGIAVRVPRIDEALLDVAFIGGNQTRFRPPDVFRGARAPTSPRRVGRLQGQITRHEIHSRALGETRVISVYVPPEVTVGKPMPVVYIADYATEMYAPLLEAAVQDGRAGRAIIVGIAHGEGPATGCAQPGHCDRRNLEYLPHFSAEGSGPNSPFGRHLRFVSDEVIPLIERTYPASVRREHRIAAGFSSGAVWAVSAAARRPDLFGNVLGLSPGGQGSVQDAAQLDKARVYLGAGLFEPSFLRATRERAELAKSAGADVRHREMVSGHTHQMWEIMFADALTWLLPPR